MLNIANGEVVPADNLKLSQASLSSWFMVEARSNPAINSMFRLFNL
jgi:hypothetical protein